MFRVKNIISAYRVDSTEEIIESQPVINEDKTGTLTYFYIYSFMGKSMDGFFPKVFRDKYPSEVDSILFMAGTEFLVCKRQEIYNYETNSITLHVYLREVQIGFGSQIFFWCDDKIY